MENRLDEKEKFENLLQKLDAEPVRKKSIGFNLISLLDGSTDAFYKPSAKYWDVIAPLGIIYLSDPSQWDVDLWIPNHPVFSPSSDDPILLQHLNQQHKGNCRVGLVSATPKANPEIKKAIFREFFDSEV
jgi:hypothetical protein